MAVAWAADALLAVVGIVLVVYGRWPRARTVPAPPVRPPARRKPPPIGFTRVVRGVTIPSKKLAHLIDHPEEHR